MNRILQFVFTSFVLVLLSPDADAVKKPNVVFFLVDDLGYMDTGAYNPKTFYETPNVDRLAKEGMKFTNGYAACPVCSPSRYAIMAGKYPTRVGATNFFSGRRVAKFRPAEFNNRMPLEEVTLGEAFKEAGYRTIFLGKWHLGPTPEFWPENQGFDVNIGGNRAGSPPGGYFSPWRNPRLKSGPKGEYLTQRLGEEAVKQVKANRDRPFFLYLSFHSVHTPLQGPKELVEKYRGKAAKRQAGKGDFATEEQVWPTKRPRRVRIRQNHATYASMVESMDAAVGRVLKTLHDLGLEENTIVCFTSDNGGLSTSEGLPTSNLPLRGGKGWVYEGGIREPFIIKWPGVTKPGSTSDVPVIGMDFYPTLLEIAGLPAKAKQHRDGVSLVPILKGTGGLKPRPLFWHYPHYGNQGGFPGGAVRMGDWKLVERYEDGRVNLYNLQTDVGERTDLAKKHPDRVAAMRKRLHAWYKNVGAKFLRAKAGGKEPWRP
jgi:arylsulfatase A-like enzyme